MSENHMNLTPRQMRMLVYLLHNVSIRMKEGRGIWTWAFDRREGMVGLVEQGYTKKYLIGIGNLCEWRLTKKGRETAKKLFESGVIGDIE